MLIKRPFWQERIEHAWRERSVVWLMGVRRVGKTSLCRSLPNIDYFDCESPRTRQILSDPEGFLSVHRGKRIVLDEIHRLDNPSELLKLAADHYSDVKIIATGSSTLGVSSKFRDTLTGRKREIWLTPLLLQEMALFGNNDLRHRFLFGGCPSFFTSEQLPEADFREWIDAYWAKDIQELFKVEKRYSFQKFTELLLGYAGGIFEASAFTAPCEITRQTVNNYLAILEETFVVHVVRPYSTHKPTEIVMAPKIYAFDTGFMCYARGWHALRAEDLGALWEQVVLNELHAVLQKRSIHYWRDKKGHEIDFVLADSRSEQVTVIECKFSSLRITGDPAGVKAVGKNIAVFRKNYPSGKNYVVAADIDTPFSRRISDDLEIAFVGVKDLIDALSTE